MKKVISDSFLIVVFIFSISFSNQASAQNEVINNLRAAIKAGSSKELVKNFNAMVELNFEGAKKHIANRRRNW
jgi:uncharacterized protein (UPF0262 family)